MSEVFLGQKKETSECFLLFPNGIPDVSRLNVLRYSDTAQTVPFLALQNHDVANPNPNPCNPRFGGQSV